MSKERLAAFGTVPVEIAVRVGGWKTTLARLAELKQGDRLELDRAIGEPFDLLAEGVRIGRVEPVACEEFVLVKLASAVETGSRDDD